MMQVLKACLNPEPVKRWASGYPDQGPLPRHFSRHIYPNAHELLKYRLSAVEVMALPYFDDIYELLGGTDLQRQYDTAYAEAMRASSPSGPSLWTGTSMSTSKRISVSQAEIVTAEMDTPARDTPACGKSGTASSVLPDEARAAMPDSECGLSIPLEPSPGGKAASDQVSSDRMSSRVSISSTPPSGKLGEGTSSPGRRAPIAIHHDAAAAAAAARHRASEGHLEAPTRSASYAAYSAAQAGASATMVRETRARLGETSACLGERDSCPSSFPQPMGTVSQRVDHQDCFYFHPSFENSPWFPQVKFQRSSLSVGLGPTAPHHIAELPIRSTLISATQRGLGMISKSLTINSVHPAERPANRGSMQSIGQVVKAVGNRIEAFVTRSFTGSSSSRVDSRRITDDLVDHGVASHRKPSVIRHSVVTGGNHRASTGCTLPQAIDGSDGVSEEGGGADLPNRPRGRLSSIASYSKEVGGGGVVLPAIGARRAL